MIPFWKKNKDGGKKKPPKADVPKTAQQSIPMQRMFEDGTCRVKANYYTRTIAYQDINYQLAQQEDKTAIFEEWCSFLNFFDLPVPDAKFETVVVKPSETQKAMVQELSRRAAEIHSGNVDASVDNMLCVTNDGRKIGLDVRLMNPMLPDDPNSKLNVCVRNVLKIWEEGKDQKLTQLLFCDLSTPKNDGNFNVYDDIRKKLIAAGVPENEIEFIHNADTEAKKAALFSKVRSGDVRVLLGSTAKMGAGTNVQQRLVAVHHLDVGWKPSDMTQRNGRIIRQGNMNKEVNVFNYVTGKSADTISREHRGFFLFWGEPSVFFFVIEAFGTNAQPASSGCSTQRVWDYPNKHFATQKWHLYIRMPCLPPRFPLVASKIGNIDYLIALFQYLLIM